MTGQCHASAALYPPGKVPRYPLDRKLVGTQNVGVGLGRLVTGIVGSNTS
jgi:hypothetical protein